VRCETAQRALSDVMDEGDRAPQEVEGHVHGCPHCTNFDRGAWRLRELTRFQVAPEVPDLTAAIMERVRQETPTRRLFTAGYLPPTRRRGWIESGLVRAAVVALIVGFVAGAVVVRGTAPTKNAVPVALASEIPGRLVGAAEELRGYRATFDVTELHWTGSVPRRTFTAQVAFRAPEAFLVKVRDTTDYPPGPWPRNDLGLITDGRAWHQTGPEPCPRAALPVCPEIARVDRTVVGRAPFDAATAMPTDVIVPMTVLAAAGRVDVVGQSTVAGREAVEVELSAEDGASLLASLRFLGSWRPFFPQDRMMVWLDRRTWFPLRYEVFPAAGPERAAWGAQNGLPAEAPDRPVFSATVRTFSQTTPRADQFLVRGGESAGQGFRDRPLSNVPTDLRPAELGPLRPWRTGAFVRTPSRPLVETVAAFARGLSWVTVTRVQGWNQRRPFGVGPFAEPIILADGGSGLYEPATSSDPRRLSLHTSRGELLVATNLPRVALERLAASLPGTGLPEPAGWRIHRWAGGVVEDGLTTAEGLDQAHFSAAMPTYLPFGYRPSSARLARTSSGSTLTVVFRRPAAELGGAGLLFTQGVGQTLAPPAEVGALAVRVDDAIGRWSPQRHLLEWMDGDAYRSLSSSSLELSSLLRVADSLQPATQGSAS
jgi:hypothetical protein